MTSYSHDSFRWSEREYGITELLKDFESQLPFLIMTTQGYTGCNQWTTEIGIADIYWLYGIAQKPRIVVKDADDNYYSIPVSYKERVIPTTIDGREAPAIQISKMVQNPSYQMFRFEKDTHRCVYSGPDSSHTVEFGYLMYVNRYNERFLMLHALLSGEFPDPCTDGNTHCSGLYPECALLPVYLPIAVAVAVGLADGNENAFYGKMTGFNIFADKCDHNCKNRLDEVSEIMVYDKKPSSKDYETVHLLHLTRTNNQNTKETTQNESQISATPKSPACATSAMNETSKRKSFPEKIKNMFKRKSKSISLDLPEGQGKNPSSPGTDSSSDSDDYLTPDPIDTEQTPLNQRMGPVAKGVNLSQFLQHLKKTILERASIPVPNTPATEMIKTSNDDSNYVQQSSSNPPKIIPRDPNAKYKIQKKPIHYPRRLNNTENPHHAKPIEEDPYAPPIPPKTFSPECTNNPQQIRVPNIFDKPPAVPTPLLVAQASKQIPVKTTCNPNIHGNTFGQQQISLGSHLKTRPDIAEARVKPSLKPKPTEDKILHMVESHASSSIKAKDTTTKSGVEYCPLANVREASMIPKQIKEFSIEDISKCLELLNLESYVNDFDKNQIDGQLITELTNEILQNDFSFKEMDAKKLIRFVKGWRPKHSN